MDPGADRAYWLSPGARRHLEEFEANRTLGFRCAMTRVGSPVDNGNGPGGNKFKTRRKKSKT